MKNFVKAIIAIVMMSVFAINGNAQNVIDSISTDDFAGCKAYLTEHPKDTIRGLLQEPQLEFVAPCDTIVCRNSGKTVISLKAGDKMFLAGYDVFMADGQVSKGNHYLIRWKNVLPLKQVADSVLVAKVDAVAEATQVALISRSYGQEQDINLYKSSVHKRTNGIVPSKAMNKRGLSIEAGAGYRLGEAGIHSFIGTFGAELTADWGGYVEGGYRIATGKYPSNAELPDESYTTHGLYLGAGWGCALDRYGVWHIYLIGGFGCDYQATPTAENEMGLLQSDVFATYPRARVKLTLDPFNSRVGFGVSFGWEQNPILTQNLGNSNKNCFVAVLTAKYPLFRDKVKTKKM